MADIRPFRAYRYDTKRVKLEDVLTQPYDKITPAMQERYYALSPYNLIAVENGRPETRDAPSNNVYTRAAKKLEEWTREGILTRDPVPSIFVCRQEYIVPGTQMRCRRQGYIALGRVEDYSAGVVFRHEQTLAAPKADRLELLRQTRAQTGQLFLLYDDLGQRLERLCEPVTRSPAPVEVRDEYGVVHALWRVSDADTIAKLREALADKKLIIADGHHRYETALNYRNECRAQARSLDPDAPHEFAMMTLFNLRSEGLTILPTHRVVSHLENFDFERFREGVQTYFDSFAYRFANAAERVAAFADFRRDLETRGRGRQAIGVYPGNGVFYLFLLRQNAPLERWLPDVSPRQRQLEVVLLHRLLLEKGLGMAPGALEKGKVVAYEREMEIAVSAVDRGEAQFACLLHPLRVEQVAEMALAEELLPQKSTDFYPKLLSGITIYRLDGTSAA